jgi:hypothetical protein
MANEDIRDSHMWLLQYQYLTSILKIEATILLNILERFMTHGWIFSPVLLLVVALLVSSCTFVTEEVCEEYATQMFDATLEGNAEAEQLAECAYTRCTKQLLIQERGIEGFILGEKLLPDGSACKMS